MKNLPPQFVIRLKKQFPENAGRIIDAFNQPPTVSVRINESKIKFFEPGSAKVPWCNSGYYLNHRPVFILDPLFHCGCYYVQDASSMFLEQAFIQLFHNEPDLKVLDLCASPGGKSTHLSSLVGERGILVANEPIRARVEVLTENIIKQGKGNVIVTNSDALEFGMMNETFDCIVVDAPCSGEGLFRKNKKAIDEWNPEKARHCSLRQKRIIEDILPALKTNGFLIYSTCTFNEDENEHQLTWMKNEFHLEGVKLELNSGWNIQEWQNNGLFGYRFMPGFAEGEGFFIAVLKKTKQTEFTFSSSNSNRNRKTVTDLFIEIAPRNFSVANDWIKETTGDRFLSFRNKIYLLSESLHEFIFRLIPEIKITYAGVEIAEKKGDGWAPSVALALSEKLNLNAFQKLALDRNEALNYLRRLTLTSEKNLQGWIVATYDDHALGFLKMAGKRLNNFYPLQWRIRNL